VNIKRCFYKASLNCLSLALLFLIYALLEEFSLSICNFDQYHNLTIKKFYITGPSVKFTNSQTNLFLIMPLLRIVLNCCICIGA
jgi:hypothetical protein